MTVKMLRFSISYAELGISVISLTSYSLLIYGATCYYGNNAVKRDDTCLNIYISGLLMSVMVTGSFAIYGVIKLGEYLNIPYSEPVVVVNPSKKVRSPLRTKRILSSKS